MAHEALDFLTFHKQLREGVGTAFNLGNIKENQRFYSSGFQLLFNR